MDSGNEIFFGGKINAESHLSFIHKHALMMVNNYQFRILLYIGSERSPPAMLPRVCVGPSTSPQHQGRVNISWDPLPCHLQNGADITGYIINYTRLSTGEAIRITSSRNDVECSQEVGGPYSCVITESLIPRNLAYSIQVAAMNNNGESLFSDPVNVSLPLSSRCYINIVTSYLFTTIIIMAIM
jgi:hypothetical protein